MWAMFQNETAVALESSTINARVREPTFHWTKDGHGPVVTNRQSELAAFQLLMSFDPRFVAAIMRNQREV